MRKSFILLTSVLMIIILATGCEFMDEIDKSIEESSKPDVSCSTEKQYRDQYGFSYYIEGTCLNNSFEDYDYLQVEYICYDKDGNNLGTAIDNTNNLLAGQSWKFKAMGMVSDEEKIDHCDFHEVTGW